MSFLQSVWFMYPAAFFVGSFPTAYLLVRRQLGIDIRTQGSGNVGATNAKRLLGWSAFLLVFVVDAGKGALVTWWGVEAELPAPGWMAVAAVAGHCFSPWLGFSGGKGIATYLGGFSVLLPQVSGLAMLAWIGAYAVFRISSIGSLLVLGVTGFAVIGWGSAALQAPVCAAIVLVVLRHRDNLQRLLSGTERPA